MMCNYMRFGGVRVDTSAEWLRQTRDLVGEFPRFLDEFESLLMGNEIIMGRAQGVGVLSPELAVSAGVSGPMLRASGVNYDVRKVDGYGVYDRFSFRVPLGDHGDVYDRYMMRVLEMRESVKICQQALDAFRSMPVARLVADAPKIVLPDREQMKTQMESLIHHFKIVTEGFAVPPGEVFQAIESPRGEMGYYVVSDGTPKPYRVHMRNPSFATLQALETMCKGRLLADVVAVIGSIDIVLGEIDR